MKKIFLVEDDPLLIKMYEKAFKREGYEVEVSFNGKEALERLSGISVKPVLIISDVMMPEMNGLDFLKVLKSNSELKGVPVVMLTNLARPKDGERALELGAVMYLVKSQYQPREILEKVKEIMAGYAGPDEIPEVRVPVKDNGSKDE